MKLSNVAYDIGKYTAQIFLPAVGTLYFALAGLWNFPNPEEVIGTITAVDAFLGVVLHLSNVQYVNSPDSHDGVLSAHGTDELTGHPNLSLTITKDPSELIQGKTVTLKVDPNAVAAAKIPIPPSSDPSAE